MITFGVRAAGVPYIDRPGAYGFLRDNLGRIALVRTPAGLFLPGGGVEAGETNEMALAREFLEEIGFEITRAEFLGEAAQYHHSVFYGASFRKLGRFFSVEARPRAGQACAPDHNLEWRSPEETRTELAQEFQRWAATELILGR